MSANSRAIFMHKPSTIYATYCPPIWHRHSLILKRLDYCNVVLNSASVSSIQKLQRVQNSAARIVLQAPRRSHAKPLMCQLHWLPVKHRIDYKMSGSTLLPWSRSKPVAWDFTVSDTYAESHIGDTATEAGAVANQAAANKIAKYDKLASTHIFYPVVIQTGGTWKHWAVKLVQEISRRAH